MISKTLFDLSPHEKLQIVEDLAANSADVPVHQWQKEELARRKANLSNHLSPGTSWNDMKARIRCRID